MENKFFITQNLFIDDYFNTERFLANNFGFTFHYINNINASNILFNNSSENQLLFNDIKDLKKTSPIFNNSFNVKLNYNSYFVYFYILFDLIINLPYAIFSFFKNI